MSLYDVTSQEHSSLLSFLSVEKQTVSEALFPLCRDTYVSTLFGVCPTFRSRITAIILFFIF